MAAASGHFPPTMRINPNFFFNDGEGEFTKSAPSALPKFAVSASSVVAFDYDQDGDEDVFVAGRQVPGRYPLLARSYLLRNDSQGNAVRFNVPGAPARRY